MPGVPTESTFRRKSRKNRKRGDRTQQDVSRFAGDAYSLAKRAVSGVKSVMRLINIEKKQFYYNFNGSYASTPSIVYMSAVTQGITMSARIGNSLRLQHICFRVWSSYNGSQAADSICRLMLVRDSECQGTNPSAGDILEDVSSTFVQCISDHDYVNSDRFSILCDYIFVMPGSGTMTLPTANIHELVVPHNGHIKYRGTDATVGSGAEGSIFALFMGNQASNAPSFSCYFSIWYTDD